MKKITLGIILLTMCFFAGSINGNCADDANGIIVTGIHKTFDFNFKDSIVQDSNRFINVKEKINSTAIEEFNLATIRAYVRSRGLLVNDNLTAEGLIAICENPGDLDLLNDTVQDWFAEEIERIDLTAEQEVRIAKFGRFPYSRGLLFRTKLTADGLIAVCETSGALNLLNEDVQNWYAEAIERTNLTAEQEVHIAKLGRFPYSRGLLFRTKLTADGLIAVCETPGDLNLQNEDVQNWFAEAIERTSLSVEQKNQITGLGF